MIQPHYIAIQLQTPDILKDLIELRRLQLQKKYPNFKQSFQVYEKKYQNHYQHLKNIDINNSINQQYQSSSQLKRKVLDQLERKEYIYFNNKKKYGERDSSPLRNNFIFQNDKTHSANPYHFSKFRKDLSRFQLKYDDKPKFLQQNTFRNIRHLKTYSIDKTARKNANFKSLNKQWEKQNTIK